MRRLPFLREGRLLLAAIAVTVGFLPAHADADTKRNIGGGVVAGTANFSPGIPAFEQGCAHTTFTLDGMTATAAVMNTVVTGYVGSFDVTGGGQSTTCELLTNGVGVLTLTVPPSTGPTGSELSCAELNGEYTRVGPVVVLTARGQCVVNQFGTGLVEFASVVMSRATNDGAGQTAPILTADLTGDFTLAPVPS